jgi:hypothetical protein
MTLKVNLKNEQKNIDKTLQDDYDAMDAHAYEKALGELSEEQREEVVRLEFTPKTKRVLAQRVGYRCSNPNCQVVSTIGPGDDEKSVVLLGEAAHIIGAIQKGISPRADSTKKISEIVSLENGIWLCRNCHRLVDSKISTYTVDALRKWKSQAEARQAKLLEEQPSTFVEKYIYPSISVDKGISSDTFETKEWCLLAFVISKYENLQSLSFEPDDQGNNFQSAYLSWMSENAIDSKKARINFDQSWERVHRELRAITNNLTGLIIMNNQGLDHGAELENFIDTFFKSDDEALDKLIRALSKI